MCDSRCQQRAPTREAIMWTLLRRDGQTVSAPQNACQPHQADQAVE